MLRLWRPAAHAGRSPPRRATRFTSLRRSGGHTHAHHAPELAKQTRTITRTIVTCNMDGR